MVACVVAHEGKHIFEIDPDGYDFHPKLHVIKTFNVSVPVQCKHCENPACLAVCQSGAISRVDNKVIIDQERCIGCKSCAEACPFGAVRMVPLGFKKNSDGTDRAVANKCDLCHGLAGGPACRRVCPTAALRLVERDDLSALLNQKRLASLQAATAPAVSRPAH
jgi:electron transport protein HydN